MPPPESPGSPVTAFPGAQSVVKPCCGSCFFWRMMIQGDKDKPDHGVCLRYPPTVHAVGPRLDFGGKAMKGPDGQLIPNLQAIRPNMSANDYCGEWSPPLPGRVRPEL